MAFHTTEYDLDPEGTAMDNWGTVLFKKRHILDLKSRLEALGHTLYTVNFNPGEGVLDRFVDVPPFEHQPRSDLHYVAAPHLRISVDGFTATSIGLLIKAKD